MIDDDDNDTKRRGMPFRIMKNAAVNRPLSLKLSSCAVGKMFSTEVQENLYHLFIVMEW